MFCFCSGEPVCVFIVLTNESKYTLCEGQYSRVQQEAEAVGPMLKGQHMYHGQKETSLWNGAKAWSRRVLIGYGLQGNRLHT